MVTTLIITAVSYALGLASGWLLHDAYATPKDVAKAAEKAAVEEAKEVVADVEKKF